MTEIERGAVQRDCSGVRRCFFHALCPSPTQACAKRRRRETWWGGASGGGIDGYIYGYGVAKYSSVIVLEKEVYVDGGTVRRSVGELPLRVLV